MSPRLVVAGLDLCSCDPTSASSTAVTLFIPNISHQERLQRLTQLQLSSACLLSFWFLCLQAVPCRCLPWLLATTQTASQQ
jgi:hypothetical protein